MTAAVGLLESTCYLRNQLLRDSDWASMDHSLELRTPLVDTQLLAELGPFVSGFRRGAGKALMSQSPRDPARRNINRPKTGFGVPMARWLSHPTAAVPIDDRTASGTGNPGLVAGRIVMADAMSCA